MHVQPAILPESVCKEKSVSHLQITKIFFAHPINDANFKANQSDIPRTTPLACFTAAAAGCAAEDEEAAYRKHELSPFDTIQRNVSVSSQVHSHTKMTLSEINK